MRPVSFLADSARRGRRCTHRPQDVGFSLGFRVARGAASSSAETP